MSLKNLPCTCTVMALTGSTIPIKSLLITSLCCVWTLCIRSVYTMPTTQLTVFAGFQIAKPNWMVVVKAWEQGFGFCILQAIKNWRQEQPGNKASRAWMHHYFESYYLSHYNLQSTAHLASFPGPAQLSVACSTRLTVLQATESWAGPGNEATAHLSTG